MRSIQYIIITGIFTCLPCSSPLAEENIMPTFEATYKLHNKGIEIGVMDRIFTQSKTNNDEYIYQSETRTTGLAALFYKDHIVEQSKLKLTGNKLLPLNYSYQRTGGKKDRRISVNFDWRNQIITNIVNDTIMHMTLEDNVLDKLMYQYAIMWDLQQSKFPGTYSIVDGRKIKTYNFELLGEESLKTPIGTFQTVKILRHRLNSEDKTLLWCALDLQYLPIKVENIEEDSGSTVAIIDSLTGLNY